MSRTPVVFVPGLGGSFNLMVLLDWRGPTLSGWDFPPFVDYGKTFLDTFTRAGYTRDVDMFVAFYDWRKSVNDGAACSGDGPSLSHNARPGFQVQESARRPRLTHARAV